jgi:hypothetical protein
MSKLVIYISIVLLGMNFSAFGQHNDQNRIDAEKRAASIEQMILDLKKISPDETTESLIFKEIKLENGSKYSIRLIEKGFLRLSNTDWIYFLSSSSHKNPEVGDITLAIDSKGIIFQNNGHVCGGIIHFETYKTGIPESSDAFFEYYESDTDGIRWEKH